MDLGTRLHQSLTPMRSLASEELITMLVLLHLQVADATSSKGTWSYSSMDCRFLFLLTQHGEGTCLFLSSRLCSHMYFLLHSAASEKHNEWPALFPYSAFYMPLQYLLFAAVSWKSLYVLVEDAQVQNSSSTDHVCHLCQCGLAEETISHHTLTY